MQKSLLPMVAEEPFSTQGDARQREKDTFMALEASGWRGAVAQARCGGAPGPLWAPLGHREGTTCGRLGVAHSPYSYLSSWVTPLEEGRMLLSVSQMEQLC